MLCLISTFHCGTVKANLVVRIMDTVYTHKGTLNINVALRDKKTHAVINQKRGVGKNKPCAERRL